MSNAVKFMPNGGVISYTYNNKVVDDKLSCDFEITDTGIGMTEEFQKHLYQPFSQENNGVLGSVQGTGLGLSLAKGIIDRMGGTIICNSKKGKGTVFRIHMEVPIADDILPQAAKKSTDMISFEGNTILLVDDHPMNLMIGKKLLQNKKATVITAENGKNALDYFKESDLYSIDAILMDVRMPVMDGLQATAEIRKLHRKDAKSVPIVAMTANAYDSDREKSRFAGMNEHLSKPFEPAKLYEILDHLITHNQLK